MSLFGTAVSAEACAIGALGDDELCWVVGRDASAPVKGLVPRGGTDRWVPGSVLSGLNCGGPGLVRGGLIDYWGPGKLTGRRGAL